MLKSKLMLAGLVCLGTFCLNAEAKLFKWVDKNGQTHYGETIPPEYSDRDSVQLSDKGRVEKTREVISADERESSRAASAKKAADEEAAREQKRKDNALLNTYTNEDEIELARNRNLQQVDARISSFSTLLKSAQATLDGHYKEQEEMTKQGRKIPKSLTEDIEESTARVEKYKKDLAQNEQEKATVQARFDADKARFRQLKGLK